MILNNKRTKTNTRTNTRTKKQNRTSIKPNTRTNTKKLNLNLEVLDVSYPDTLLQSIKNNQDITTIPNVSNIYKNPPQITILNPKAKLYLITMTDPDAPYGMKKTNTMNNSINTNHTYTHWIYLQDMRNKSKTNTNSTTNATTILLPYAPPSPPYGIHRYQFNLYNVSNVSQMILDTLKNNISNTLDRNIDYVSNLNNLSKMNNTKKLKPIVQIQYKVNSGKLPTTATNTTTNTTPNTTPNTTTTPIPI
jgi:phosphatidylethanolamine-binding protein (PEBP) family uncharacterized protein